MVLSQSQNDDITSENNGPVIASQVDDNFTNCVHIDSNGIISQNNVSQLLRRYRNVLK